MATLSLIPPFMSASSGITPGELPGWSVAQPAHFPGTEFAGHAFPPGVASSVALWVFCATPTVDIRAVFLSQSEQGTAGVVTSADGTTVWPVELAPVPGGFGLGRADATIAEGWELTPNDPETPTEYGGLLRIDRRGDLAEHDNVVNTLTIVRVFVDEIPEP